MGPWTTHEKKDNCNPWIAFFANLGAILVFGIIIAFALELHLFTALGCSNPDQHIRIYAIHLPLIVASPRLESITLHS